MQLIEAFTKGKRVDQRRNEDGYLFNENWALVVDGCSSITSSSNETESSGRIARTLILETVASLDPTVTKEELFSACNSALRSHYQTQGQLSVYQEHPQRRAGAYLAAVSRYHRELWILGDCQALIKGVHYSKPKIIDTLMEDLRALLVEHALLTGKTKRELQADPSLILEKLAPIMELQSAFQNADPTYAFTYYTLDGFFEDYSQILSIPLGPDPVEVVLATDGYPRLCESLEASEAALQDTIKADPLLYQAVRSVKGVEEGNFSFDDRTYLRFIV